MKEERNDDGQEGRREGRQPEVRRRPLLLQAAMATIMLLLMVFVIMSLLQSKSNPAVIFLWCASILLFSAASASLVGIIRRKLGTIFLFAAVITLVVTLIVQTYVPYCGDGVCSSGECASGCIKDCTLADCQDGKCEPPIERCDNSPDCKCASGFVCAPLRAFNATAVDSAGCFPVTCGDGYCDKGENSETCCADCGCSAQYECKSGRCMYLEPLLSLSPRIIAHNISATTLAGNPLLTDDSGTPHPLITLVLGSTRPVTGVSVAFSIPGFMSSTVPIGDIGANGEGNASWYLTPEPKLLTVVRDTPTMIIMNITYRDTLSQSRQRAWSVPFTIMGRDVLDGRGSPILYVTGGIALNNTAVEDVWAALRGRVNATPATPGTLRFPAETLAAGKGAPDDIAVLLASAYESAGYSTELVETDRGLFVHVRTDAGNILLDPSMIGAPFKDAVSDEPGYAVYDVEALRRARSFTVLSLNNTG